MKTIQLQSIGRKKATEAKNIRVGDVLIWNFGGREKVTKITPSKTGKTMTLKITNPKSKWKGERRINANTLVATEELNPGTPNWS